MTWTMPRPLLQVVAALLFLCAAGSFVMGIVTAPERGGRLPGERAPGSAGVGPAAPLEATDATPLGQERIEGPPKPVEKAAAKDEDEGDKEQSADQPTNTIPLIKPPAEANGPENPSAQPSDTGESNAPPPDEPPH